MIASRSRLFAASLTVLAVALAGHASAQETTPPAPTPDTHPPAVILEPGQTAPGQVAPGQAPTEAAPDPHIIITDTPATPAIPAVWAPIPTNAEGRSAYGVYLAGKLALMQGEGATAVSYTHLTLPTTPYV